MKVDQQRSRQPYGTKNFKIPRERYATCPAGSLIRAGKERKEGRKEGKKEKIEYMER